MALLCPRCSRVLADSADSADAPLFCMFCGQKLRDTVVGSSVVSLSAGNDTLGYIPSDGSDSQQTDTRTNAAATRVEVQSEVAPSSIGGYKLHKFIGAGGMGSVYEAEAELSGQRVAVKLLSRRLASNPSSVERFRQEGRLASQIAHPRCVFVLRADTDAGRPYIIMELMPGRTLKDLVDDRGPLPVSEAIQRTIDVIDGLIEAHRLGVIHRDVKPSNCFLTEDDRVKVGDFGLSKSLGSNADKQLTQSGAFLGTVLFASPEQIRGEAVGYDTDVYAVSATLYFLLTGQAPHQHESLTAALAKAISEAPPSVRVRCPLASSELDRVILRGLERDRARRYATLEELREALLGLLPERQQPARPRSLFLAYVIDYFVVQLAVVPLELLRQFLGLAAPTIENSIEGSIIPSLISFFYFTLFEGIGGATPGKRILKLRVVRIGETGPPGVLRAGLRTFVYSAIWFWMLSFPAWIALSFGDAVTFALGSTAFISGLILLCLQLRRTEFGYRGAHDLSAKTRVVQLPRPSKRRKLVSPFPNPLERIMKSSLPIPATLGGFTIDGKICEIGDGGEVWVGEDRSLGRRVVLRIEPPGIGDDSLFDEPIVRPTRLRSVGHGTLVWGGGERAWIAYVAPSGVPLPDVVAPGTALSWAEVQPLLEQLAAELSDGGNDGSAPAVLSPEQIWVEPNGRMQLVDFPMPTGRAVVAGETKSRYPGGSFTPLDFARQIAALTLEGSARRGPGAIRAPLPGPASLILDRLFNDGYKTASELRDDLAANQNQPPAVTAGGRIAHILLQGLLMGTGLFTMFLMGGFFNFFAAIAIHTGSQMPDRVLESIETPEKRAAVLKQVDEQENADDPMRQRLEFALAPDNFPDTRRTLERSSEALRADSDSFRDRLNRPERYVWELLRNTARVKVDPAAIDRHIQFAKADPMEGRVSSRATGLQFLTTFTITLLIWPFVFWPLSAWLFRGGLAYWFSGIALVRPDGSRAGRFRCALRELVIWLPLTLFLLASLLIQWEWPTLVLLRSIFWLAAVAVLPASFAIALRDPTRTPVDRMMGLFLLPR